MFRRLLLLLAWCSAATGAAAQTLPSEPIAFGGGRVVLSGDVSASFAPEDTGFFNYSDYERTTLRTLRLGLTAAFRVSDRISILGDVRSENLGGVWPMALYARISPLPGRRLDVQVGRIPPTFGPFSRRAYGRDNPLIGTPLAYQYLTSLRADALPADIDELLAMRGRGWLSAYTIGDRTPGRGVPLVSAFTFDTGVQVTTGWRMVEVTGSVTNGTLSNPRVTDDNAGKQVAVRISVTPAAGLVMGSSFARGPFVSRGAISSSGVGHQGRYTQTVQGLDVEYSRGHWIARADAVLSTWRIPLASAGRVQSLRAAAIALESRYTFLPGAYAAARVEHLGFSRVSGSVDSGPWDAPVSRLEVGGGYYLQRNVIARMSLQINRRDAGRTARARLLAGQILFWF